jgi:hypothetical protein
MQLWDRAAVCFLYRTGSKTARREGQIDLNWDGDVTYWKVKVKTPIRNGPYKWEKTCAVRRMYVYNGTEKKHSLSHAFKFYANNAQALLTLALDGGVRSVSRSSHSAPGTPWTGGTVDPTIGQHVMAVPLQRTGHRSSRPQPLTLLNEIMNETKKNKQPSGR